jgi:RNA polymerase sigma factor (sigma-70 family)
MPRIDVSPEDIARATDGDPAAMSRLVRALERPFYALARRMTLSHEDAEEAAQEALLRVVTRLSQFDGRAQFSTWAYRIAVNQAIDHRSSRRRRLAVLPLSQDDIASEIANGIEPEAPERADDRALLRELKLACGLTMLATLDGPHRAAYVLGEVMELSSDEAAEVLEVEPATFRKRLSRARDSVRATLAAHCGMVEPANACRCHRRLTRAQSQGWVGASCAEASEGSDLEGLDSVRARLAGLAEAERAAAFYRADAAPQARRDVAAQVLTILRTTSAPRA